MEKSARPRTALNECVKVVVRCRPLSARERAEGHDEVVQVSPERGAVQVLNPKGQDKLFTYDAVYDASADTQTIYDEMVRPLVASVLDGFNGCVYAYGQTGTGKTHTMEGTAEDEGIIPRAFRHIWAHIETSASRDVTHLVSCSYVELYLEDVRDLLSKDCKKLTIRGQELNGFYIPEMTSIVCKSAAEMARALRAGNRVRAAGRTDMNEHSSRSHAVFLVTVESQQKGSDRIRVGKLNLVDLAGSERQRKTNAGGERLREAARINQALSSLGNVISALAENSPHVPYRDSKLTRILQDSLGGNSKTIMIAAVGPAAYNYDETITTLRYAHRAKAIKNKPIRNEDPKDAKLREYQAEIERLRALIEQRRAAERRPRRAPRTPLPRPTEDTPDTAELEQEHNLAESTIEQEKSRTSELEQQIRSLEERLVSGGGGGDLLTDLVASRAVLDAHQNEIAERKKREVEMQQKIDLEEETTASVTQTFASLQQEVDHKTQRLKKCVSKYACLREEMVELREAHDGERREHEALQAALVAGLRRRLLLADSFVPLAGRAAVARLAYDDDADCWLPRPHRYTSGGLRRRLLLADSFVPLAGRAAVARLAYDDDADCWLPRPHRYTSGGLRRRLLLADSFVPLAGRAAVARLAYDDDADCWLPRPHRYTSGGLRRRLLLADSFVPLAGRAAVARLAYDDDADCWLPRPHSVEPLTARPTALGSRRPACAADGAPRPRAENLLDLRPVPLPPTTRAYVPPRPQKTMETSMKKEELVSRVEAPARRASSRPRPGTAHHRLGTAGGR